MNSWNYPSDARESRIARRAAGTCGSGVVAPVMSSVEAPADGGFFAER
jgi:hypothetical protein